jgi:putative PIN family toxin of toxin-antitoxin system
MSRIAVPRWVIDTNVALSALIRPGQTTGRLRLAWQAGLFIPLGDSVTVGELLSVLAYPKFHLSAAEQHDLLGDYLSWLEVVRMPARRPATPLCRDPFDMPFLQLLLAAKADALVTGDADLLALSATASLTIITPAQAVQALST